jgi:potassium-transporting ATPase KdpC subunit
MRRHLITSLIMLLGLTLALGVGYPLLVTGVSALGLSRQAEGSLLYRDGGLVGSSLLGQSFSDDEGNPIPRYFQPRPSAAGTGYDAASSAATNLGPSNPLLIGFVAGVNTVDLDGNPSPTNPFATAADPTCVPVDPEGEPVTSPGPDQAYAKTPDGSFDCDPDTVPQRAIAYRSFNGLAADATVPIDAVTASGSGLDPAISVENALAQAPRVARARRLPERRVSDLVSQHISESQLGFLGEPRVNVLELNLAVEGLR